MRFGVIGGAGKIGRMRVETILNNARTELVAVMDLNADAARDVAAGAPVFTDPDDFFGYFQGMED